ncbi:lipopolysaccharide cholinephosphotransferase LicD [Clostridia bacterium]|nr:lipopolysaccharide cholinephosphotransferase LicD [Clostridia bacterium]
MEKKLEQIHQANLCILKEIHRICQKYKISYSLDSGTLLGAIRHQGFIPWDDDADVVFLRKDYERFLSVAKKELSGKFELLLPKDLQEGEVFYDFTPRILNKESKIQANNEEMQYYGGKMNHLWVDLFVLDRISDKPFLRWMRIIQLKIVYALAMGHRYQMEWNKYPSIIKIGVWILSNIGKKISMKKIYAVWDVLSKKDAHQANNRLYYSNYQPDYLPVYLAESWCSHIIEKKFESENFLVFQGYQHILKNVYGDYHCLPPLKKRMPTHVNLQEFKLN